MKEKRSSFTGSIGFVMAAAGSAVGLGNIWRFPYLAAKNGGGLFLVIYLILVLTFGYTLLTTEIAIGRKTKQSPLTAYRQLHPKFGFVGILACLVPTIIMPYYCSIGGWVLKYCTSFITGQGSQTAEDGFFGGFITETTAPIIFMLIFLFISGIIVFLGVDKGIERFSKILMPVLLVIIVGISIFGLTLNHTDAEGVTRTGMEGLSIYLIPDFSNVTLSSLLQTIVDAVGQLFFSISVAMGIMVTYGSYVKDDTSLGKCINQIEIFDTAVAFLAGLMIIPAVYVFMGTEGMGTGPSLMFVTLPKVFHSMGKAGFIFGILFFVMVLVAAITSAVSVMEAIVSSIMDQFHVTRKKACVFSLIISTIVGVLVCLGYNALYFEFELPNGAIAQILDILDYVSNNLLMPIVSLATCIFIGWILKPQVIIDEVEKSGHRFGRRKVYIVMIRYVAPIMLTILLLQSIGLFH